MPSPPLKKNSYSQGGFKHYLTEHQQTAGESIDQLWIKPFGSLMTILLIGLSLSLPLALIVMLENGDKLVGSWEGQSKVSLFMKMDVSEQSGLALSQRLALRSEVRKLRYLSKEQSLKEFESSSGISVPLALLDENPLPAVIILEAKASSSPDDLSRLRDELSLLPEVEYAQLDLLWMKRLQAMLQIGVHLAQVLALILALVVLFVVMNTLKLLIEHRRNEIEITLLVGGSHAYIRRPFLYLGLWYGLFGGLLAVTVVELLLWWLESPVARMSSLYDSSFQVQSMPLSLFFQVLLFSSLLGVMAAWLEVGMHLRRALAK
ncbi:MAG: ABC transporter permease [Pseudomonadales bacterium]|nr:ABC transporter permease [Pseudomonadales bacterium]